MPTSEFIIFTAELGFVTFQPHSNYFRTPRELSPTATELDAKRFTCCREEKKYLVISQLTRRHWASPTFAIRVPPKNGTVAQLHATESCSDDVLRRLC